MPSLRIQLVENRDLLRRGNRRIDKQLAQFGAAVPRAQKIIELPVHRRRIQLERMRPRQQMRWRTVLQMRRPSVSPSAFSSRPRFAHKLGNQSAIGLRRQHQFLRGLFDGQVGGKVPQRTFGLRRRHADLLLGRGHDARALFFKSGLAALLVLRDLLLYFGAELRNLLVETG